MSRSEPRTYDTAQEARELAQALGCPDRWGEIDNYLCDAFWEGRRAGKEDRHVVR